MINCLYIQNQLIYQLKRKFKIRYLKKLPYGEQLVNLRGKTLMLKNRGNSKMGLFHEPVLITADVIIHI